MREKGKFFLTKEFQLINVEIMREIENHSSNATVTRTIDGF